MLKFLLGIGLGFAIGVVIAPKSGEEMREDLLEKAKDIQELPRQKMGEAVKTGREKTQEMARETAEKAYDRAAEKVVGPDIVKESRRA